MTKPNRPLNLTQRAVLDICDELDHAISMVVAYENSGRENTQPTITGNQVSLLMGGILKQLHSIRAGINAIRYQTIETTSQEKQEA